MWDDIIIAYRRLLRNGGSTLMIVVLLAMAIGANACVFSIVYGLLYKPLPYPSQERLVFLSARSSKMGIDLGWSAPYLDAVARETKTLDTVAGYRLKDVALSDNNGRFAGTARAIVTQPQLLSLLGARPALGRLLQPDDARVGASPSVVISWDLWKSRYGGAPDAIERYLRMGDQNYRIVGVLPQNFGFPQLDRQVWLPLGFQDAERLPSQAGAFTDLQAVGRLRPAQSMSGATSEMMSLATRDPALQAIAKEIGLELGARPMRSIWVEQRETSLKFMMLAVLLILVVTLANVCNLYILRLLRRRQELAVLEAVGAGLARRFRQMLCEVILLCLAAAMIGAVLTPLGLTVLRHFDVLPNDTPQVIGGDLATAAFIAIIWLAVVVAMTASGFSLQRQNIYEVLRQTGNGQTASPRAQRVRKVLVVGQVALTLILLFGTGLLLRSSQELLNEDVGFERTKMLIGRLQPFETPSDEQATRQRAALGSWTETVSGTSGIEAVGLASATPFGENIYVERFLPQDFGFVDLQSQPSAYTSYVSAKYFSALGLPVKKGRAFTEQEARASAAVAIIDANLAKKYFSGDPIGRTVSVTSPESVVPTELTVVGVVGAAKQRSLGSEDEYPTLYRPEHVPYRVHGIPVDEVEILVRTHQEPGALIGMLERQMAQFAPDLRFVRLISMEERISDTIKDRLRLNALLQILGAIATLLAAVGLYGVLSYMVSMRYREFGVLQALGANSSYLMRDVFIRGGRLIGMAFAVGLPLACILGVLLRSQLYHVSALDPVSLLAVVALFSVVGLIANWGPAYRASKIRPIDALRTE